MDFEFYYIIVGIIIVCSATRADIINRKQECPPRVPPLDKKKYIARDLCFSIVIYCQAFFKQWQ